MGALKIFFAILKQFKKAFKNIIENGLCTSPAKAIYDFMIQDVTISNKSLIPSRSDVGKHNCSIQISHAE